MQPLRVAFLLAALAACGPQLGGLEEGEVGRVVRAYSGDTLELDTGLRVFLAEIDAPRGEAPYASQAQGELEALALHRTVQLAYGGAKRWAPPVREGQSEPPPEAAIAHVFVRSEGGRWFWLQHELVSRGAAYVRPRPDNRARTAELLALEARARAEERGMWGRREYRPLTPRSAVRIARRAGVDCSRGPYRVVEGRVAEAAVAEERAALLLDGAGANATFAVVVFGDDLAGWEGPPLDTLEGARVRARGALGLFEDAPQMCLEHGAQLEVLPES